VLAKKFSSPPPPVIDNQRVTSSPSVEIDGKLLLLWEAAGGFVNIPKTSYKPTRDAKQGGGKMFNHK
jgi:hypothetical protein